MEMNWGLFLISSFLATVMFAIVLVLVSLPIEPPLLTPRNVRSIALGIAMAIVVMIAALKSM